MTGESFTYAIVLIFAGAAFLGTLFLYARQSLIVAYILLGILIGPAGLGLIDDVERVHQIAELGIIFLLYLLGLNLHPQKLIQMFREVSAVTLVSALGFLVMGAAIALAFGFPWIDALVIGAACMFSSTILALKLLPTTTLHHRHAGGIIISVLLIQDLIAIVIMIVLQGFGAADMGAVDIVKLTLALPVLLAVAFGLERYLLIPLLQRFDRVNEYAFLLAIGWCLGVAQLAAWLGLSYAIGAFIAGVSLAAGPIARYIADSLKELRDFFLIIFFVSLGASFQVSFLAQITIPALVLSAAVIVVKPVVFRWLLGRAGEKPGLSWEMGARLGSGSEFALLIALMALQAGVISARASYLIQAMTLICFLASSYIIVLKYPTPSAVSDKLRQD